MNQYFLLSYICKKKYEEHFFIGLALSICIEEKEDGEQSERERELGERSTTIHGFSDP